MTQQPAPASAALPKVTIGVPVRNGAAHLERALESLVSQTLADIEIVVSDNASDDATADILRRFAERDGRIRTFRQPELIPVIDNFRFVLQQARAPYFMWAAHDDSRAPEFVERLWARLESTPEAVLACGDLVEQVHGDPQVRPADYATDGLPVWARMRKTAAIQCFHIYGLWRTDVLRGIPMVDIPWWPDTPIMVAAAAKGTFAHVPGVTFFYRFNPKPFFGLVAPGETRPLWKLLKGGRALAILVAQSGRTVSGVAGPAKGAYAAWLAFAKSVRQVAGFLGRRM